MAHILIIDDDRRVHDRLTAWLRDSGHALDHANDSDEARRLLEGVVLPAHAAPFDLIICDNMMQRSNEGVEFGGELWLEGSNIPFILHTSSNARELPKGWEKWHIELVQKVPVPDLIIPKINEILRESVH